MLIRPVVTDGAETWTQRTPDEHTLSVSEKRTGRRIYGTPLPPLLNEEWRLRSNHKSNLPWTMLTLSKVSDQGGSAGWFKCKEWMIIV
jgi:hypothetical protein